MKKELAPKDRVYKLIGNATPLSYMLPSRNGKRTPLLWYDDEKNVTRALRYASNQRSPFEDEQDGNVILEPVVFEDGFLSVPKSNPVLQMFLAYHPFNGRVFEEVNKENDAQKELDVINIQLDALVEARQLTVDQLEAVYRVLFDKDPSTFATAEIKRDVIIFAKKDPQGFMNVIKDPMLKFNAKVRVFFESGLLALRNNDREVWFNTKGNKRKMLNVPFGEDPYTMVSVYLKTDEGIEALKFLESQVDQ